MILPDRPHTAGIRPAHLKNGEKAGNLFYEASRRPSVIPRIGLWNQVCPGFLLFLFLVLAGRLAGAAEIRVRPPSRIEVETSRGKVVFDSGVVVEASNRLTGETYTRPDAAPRLTGLFWQEEAGATDTARKLEVRKESATRAVMDATLADGCRLTMSIEVDVKTEDVVIRQSGRVSRGGLSGIQWGLTGLDASATACIIPAFSGIRLDRNSPFLGRKFSWPGSWEVQMMVVEGKKGGLWVWAPDRELRFKSFSWQREGDEVSLGFRSLDYAPFEAQKFIRSTEWRLAFYRGDWRVPARRYRAWMQASSSLVPLSQQEPAWVKGVRFVCIVSPKSQGLLEELSEQVLPRATLLYVPDWRRDGYDRNYPDYTAIDGFAAWVRKARQMGFHVMPHANYFGCTASNPAYQRFRRWHIRKAFSGDLAWWISPRQRFLPVEERTTQFAYISPASREWREELTRRLVEAQKRYGFDAVHLDQTLGMFNDHNGLIDGISCIRGNILLHESLRRALPQVALSGEGLNEITCRYEAFAQRHAPMAVNHVFGTWDDAAIQIGHPISSFFLLPYTWMYGYLGMANPSNHGLYLAWKSAYENWGVIPTFSRPFVRQLQRPGGKVQALIREARTWTTHQLKPDFESDWGPGDKFHLSGKEGALAVIRRDGQGGSEMALSHKGRDETVYRILKGRTSVPGRGTIVNWIAYDEEQLFGLDPRREYIYLDVPRALSADHVSRAPANILVQASSLDPHKLVARFEPYRKDSIIDLVARADTAEMGIVVDGQKLPLGQGGSFQAMHLTSGLRQKRGIFEHPPWKIRPRTKQPVRTFGQFELDLPEGRPAALEFQIGLRDGVLGRSDGAQFIVLVNGKTVFDQLWAESKWKENRVDLSSYAGQKVRLNFITTTGPKQNASFDWACWGEPRVRLDTPPRDIQVQFSTRRAPTTVLGSDESFHWKPGGKSGRMFVSTATLEAPGSAILLWAKPSSVSLPLNLAKAPFTVSYAVNLQPVLTAPQHAYARPGEGVSSGEGRDGLSTHPPNHGRTSADYLLELPRQPVKLTFATGLRDGSKSEAAVFLIEINGRQVYRNLVTGPDGWHPGEVDLSAYAGQSILLSLVIDAAGTYYFDWGFWANPKLVGQ